MAHTRTVTGTIHKPDGTPWEGFAVSFDVIPTATTTHATLPATAAGAATSRNTITATTDASGAWAVALETGVTIRVTLTGALLTSGTSTRYPAGAIFDIVVPAGATPISLETIRAGAITDPGDPTLVNSVAQVASDLADHEADTGNPHAVTAGQVGAYTQAEVDQAITDARNDAASASGVVADALADLIGDLGSAAYTDADAYATAAQGGKADTAVQPGDLADVATSGAYGDLTGTPAIPAALIDLDTSVTGAELDALKQAADQHGDIVTHNADEFATAAQGAKADTALQPDALNDYETTTQLNSRDTANRDRANHTGTQTASTISDFAAAADARIDAQKAEPDGLATLDAAGHVPTDQLPPLAVTEVHVVADEAAMLALDAQAGDMAIREDSSRAYVHNGGTAGTVADWTLLAVPPDAVLSVNGKTGTVSLVKADVGLGNVDNTSDADKPISDAAQVALDAKAPAILTSKGDLYGHDGTDPARVPVGQVGQVLVADSGQDAGVGWERRAYPLPDSGGYAMSSMLLGMRQTGYQTHTLAQDTLTVVPIEVPRRSRFTYCQIFIDEATAAGELRLGLFRGADGLNQFTHIDDIAVVSTTASGIKIITPLSIWCDPGVYWIGMLASEETKVRAITPARGLDQGVASLWAEGNRRKVSVPFGAFDPVYSGFISSSDPYTPLTGLYPIGGS